MNHRFHKSDSSQLHQLQVSSDQWVQEDHLARFPWDCVEQFNLERFCAANDDERASP